MARTHNLMTVAGFIHDHLDARPIPQLPTIASLSIINRSRLMVHACKAQLVTGGHQPYYDHTDDVIVMPSPAFYAFARIFCPTAYASTLLHELCHWTGHRRRLGRQVFRQPFDQIYAREELVAELGSALLCHDLAITTRPTLPHASYLNSFLATLPNPAIDLSVALSHANQATAYLTALTRRHLNA